MNYTQQQIDFIREYSPDNKQVEWHHVFAKLKEMGLSLFLDDQDNRLIVREKIKRAGGFSLNVCPKEYINMECNPSLSPMLQPTLIEELLKLKQ